VRLGAHESAAGGLHLVFGRGELDGCEAVQLFSAPPSRWSRRLPTDEEASLFRSEAARLGWPVLVHASYLLNLASPDPSLAAASVDALVDELVLAETLGVDHVVLHPGAHRGEGERRGLARVARGLREVVRQTRGFSVRILVENTAGAGTTLGGPVEHLARLLEACGGRGGVCLDTCHAFAAGHRLDTDEGRERLLEGLARLVGIGEVRALHLNDSRRAAGSRVDRHAHVGEGEIGLAAFRALLAEPRLADAAGIVETPPEADGGPSFSRNLGVLKGLRP
jgi:deoxyribonuclease IV